MLVWSNLLCVPRFPLKLHTENLGPKLAVVKKDMRYLTIIITISLS